MSWDHDYNQNFYAVLSRWFIILILTFVTTKLTIQPLCKLISSFSFDSDERKRLLNMVWQWTCGAYQIIFIYWQLVLESFPLLFFSSFFFFTEQMVSLVPFTAIIGYWPSNVLACGFWFLPFEWQFSCSKCREISAMLSSEHLNTEDGICSAHNELQCFLKTLATYPPVFIGLSLLEGKFAIMMALWVLDIYLLALILDHHVKWNFYTLMGGLVDMIQVNKINSIREAMHGSLLAWVKASHLAA